MSRTDEMGIESVFCPMYRQNIDFGICLEAQMVVDDEIIQLPEIRYFVHDDMKPICKACLKRDDPRA